jgi:uncharacterized membrane protein
MVGAIVLLVQQLGFKDLIPSNYADVVNSLLTILTMLGIVNDTKITSNFDATATVQAVADSLKSKLDDSKTVSEAPTTTAANITVTENSASSKIVVDNPNNIQAIGQQVDATSATKPQ